MNAAISTARNLEEDPRPGPERPRGRAARCVLVALRPGTSARVADHGDVLDTEIPDRVAVHADDVRVDAGPRALVAVPGRMLAGLRDGLRRRRRARRAEAAFTDAVRHLQRIDPRLLRDICSAPDHLTGLVVSRGDARPLNGQPDHAAHDPR